MPGKRRKELGGCTGAQWVVGDSTFQFPKDPHHQPEHQGWAEKSSCILHSIHSFPESHSWNQTWCLIPVIQHPGRLRQAAPWKALKDVMLCGRSQSQRSRVTEFHLYDVPETGMVVYTCNPSTLGRLRQEDRMFEPSPGD